MRQVIKDTHDALLNLAISPGVILTPNRMIILDNPIKGFNNTLTTATNDMSFGYNTNINKTQRERKAEKITADGQTHRTPAKFQHKRNY